MNNFNEFKELVSSEKITLATIEPSKRLIAFSLHSGSVYKIENFDIDVIVSIKELSDSLIEVDSIAEVIAGKFFNDRENKILYLRTSDSTDPNAKFLHMSFKLFFSSVPVTASHDLDEGFEVYWEPQISSTSNFGVEIDTVNQQNETIEGSGSLTLFNDQAFWPKNFDKLFFDNQNCSIYSWNRQLAPTEAKLLFRGKIESKSYASDKIVFRLKDLMSLLRNAISFETIGSLGLRNSATLAQAKQRHIYGRLFGYRPTNVDVAIDGMYPLTGTISATTNSDTLSGSGTQFLTEVSPDDRVVISDVEYSVASVIDDVTLTLTEVYAGVNVSGVIIQIRPDQPKRWINRIWCLAGHSLRQPQTTVSAGSSVGYVFVTSTEDMFAGDYIYFGELPTGQLVRIDEVVNATTLRLADSLSAAPVVGSPVYRPPVQDLRMNDIQLIYGRDYTVDAETAMLTIDPDAELNASPIRESLDSGTFTNGSRNVTGSGTFFKTFLKPGFVIRPKGSSDWLEILTVVDDENLELRSAPSGLTPNPKTSEIQYKSFVFNEGDDVLSCEIVGRTSDGTPLGNLLRKAPEIVRQLVSDAGFPDSEIDEDSFADSQFLVQEDLGFAVPKVFSEKSSPIFRDVINSVNKSVFGIIYQNNDFKISYDVLRPVIPTSPLVIKESDCINWSCESTNKNMVSKTIVEYRNKEYDYNTGEIGVDEVSSESDTAKFILNTSREKTFSSVLINEEDAQRLSNRWKFLLEFSTNQIRIQTKLQMINSQINDIVDFEHRKFYERFSGTSKRKFLAIESIKKNGLGVEIQCVDLSNAFNRIALISETETNWSESGEDTRINTGFISDSNGLIDNDENSHQVNLIW
jgi:hypothetical protein